MRIYTKKGDDGTTGLLYGGRVGKDAPRIELNGALDEAQAALGVARAEAAPGSSLDELLVLLERQLYVLMAEVATMPANRPKLVAGVSLVTADMVTALEARIDELGERVEMPTEFVVPGGNRRSAALDVARTVVRRAERVLVAVGPLEGPDGGAPSVSPPASVSPPPSVSPSASVSPGGGPPPSHVGPYLNRLSDLLWTMARWQEGSEHLAARDGAAPAPGAGGGPG